MQKTAKTERLPEPVATRGAQSLERAVMLLKHVTSNGHGGLRIADLVALTGMERPTVHRMVQALIRLELLSALPGSKRYVLGDYCRELGAAFSDRSDLRAVCEPVLRGVSDETGNSSFLVVRLGLDSLCVARAIGSFPIQVLSVRIGNRQPLGIGAGGLAMLATLSRDEQDPIISANAPRLQGYGQMSPATLKAVLRTTQKRGYAVIGHYSVPGVIGVGVALRNGTGDVLGAVTTASVDSRMNRIQQEASVHSIQNHVAAVQSRLDAL